MKTRPEIWSDLKNRAECQVLILGGGINGTAVLRELAHQGIDCVLADKADFVAGASSTSSRMIHGGLRYLENAEYQLVSEAVHERNRLLQYAPHYIFPLKTTIPIDSWFAGLIKSPLVFFGFPVTPGGRGAIIVKLGLMFYDFFTRKNRQTPTHFLMSGKKSLQQIPGLRKGIVCTANYWDAWVSQAERFCVNMIREACMVRPETIALNYIDVRQRDASTVELADQASGETTVIRPEVVVNATGGWIDFTNRSLGVETHLMGGTKGSHLVIDNQDLYDALGDRMVYYEHTDGRICITFRFLDKVIMGSTDIKVDDPDQAVCEEEEVEYMMTSLRGVFPELNLSRDDIVFKFCGVRPLPTSRLDYTSRVPRSHFIETSEPDKDREYLVYSLIGGKLTTFGTFAEQVTDKILSDLGKERLKTIDDQCFLGAEDFPKDEASRLQWISRTARDSGLDEGYVKELLHRYGMEAENLLKERAEQLKQPLQSLPQYSIGEIQYIAQSECIRHLSDLVRRRSVITLLGASTEKALKELAEVAGACLDWDASRKKQEVALAFENANSGK